MTSDPNTKKVLILVAHGSRRPASNQEIADLTTRLRQSLHDSHFDIVTYCFLEIASPSIDSCVQSLCKQNPMINLDIDFLPYFLSSGIHVEKDIPNAINKALNHDAVINCNQLDYIGKNATLLDALTRTAMHIKPTP